MSALRRTHRESVKPYVPIQLTRVIPVRVFNPSGEFFDTEVDLDAPINIVQLAIEDYFRVKPNAQLLTHNGQQLRCNRSLRENGCLLLKGDPFVKIVCSTKRGPILNLVCRLQLRNSHDHIPIACHEESTVWEAKQILCGEIASRQGELGDGRSSLKPNQVKLFWRYIDLNNKATLQYYRMPTNSHLSVRVCSSRGATCDSDIEHLRVIAREPFSREQPEEGVREATAVTIGKGVERRGPAASPSLAEQEAYGQHRSHDSAVVLPPPPSSSDAQFSSVYSTIEGLQRQVNTLKYELGSLQGRFGEQSAFQATISTRVCELEDTVLRFEGYLERAISLIP